eukprot:Gb_09603 [translate_table: standard]
MLEFGILGKSKSFGATLPMGTWSIALYGHLECDSLYKSLKTCAIALPCFYSYLCPIFYHSSSSQGVKCTGGALWAFGQVIQGVGHALEELSQRMLLLLQNQARQEHDNRGSAHGANLPSRDFCDLRGPRNIQRLRKRKPPRPKFKLPRFNGTRNGMRVSFLIHKLNQYFCIHSMDDDERIHTAILHLEETTYDWWHHVDMDVQEGERLEIMTWEEFSLEFLATFDTKNANNYVVELKNLKKMGSVNDYVANFSRLVVLVHVLSRSQQVSIFLDNLKGTIRGSIKAHALVSLEEAINNYGP